MNTILKIYNKLMGMYGPQGWWPIIDVYGKSVYDGRIAVESNERFEICVGAILTQNTTWKNVEKVLYSLKKSGLLNPNSLILSKNLPEIIKSAGYYNQKSKKLKIFSEYFLNLKGSPSRENLLDLWGIGPETADSIMLYAFDMPTFVIDSYTIRIMQNLNMIKDNCSYEQLRNMFMSALPLSTEVFKEYHALLVRHAKEYYNKKPYECPLWAEVQNGK
jgi:endonuclease III related protein